jgi:two-component system NtrC family sensor kinase
MVPNPVRILVIDDNPVDRARILQELGPDFPDLQAQQVADEHGFAGAMEAGEFDVVLCDYALPWTDGLTLLRVIKARWPAAPVIMVTGSGNEEIAIEAIKAGLDDYILKSAKHLARLPSAVRSALDRADQRDRLEEVEARYRTVFDRVPVGLYRATPGGEFLDVNPALVDILGYASRDALMAVHASELYVNPEDRIGWQRKAEQDGLVRHFEVPLRRRDGSIAWLRNSARVVRNLEGRVLCYEGSLEDITERKRAEDALARRMRQLDAIREATQEITCELDLTLLLNLIARRAAELVGGSSGGVFLWDGAVQVIASSAWWGPQRLFEVDRWRLGEGIVGTVAERRQGVVVNDYRASAYARPTSAELASAAAVMAEPLVYGDRLLGVIAVAAEKDERRFSESDRHVLGLFAVQAVVAMENARLFGEISQAKREWENTFNAAADMIAVMDTECRILRVNQALAAHLRTEPAALIGQRCDEVFDGCGSRSGEGAFARCVESGRPVTEEREMRKTGQVWLQTHSPFVDARGRLIGVVQVSKDVTAQRQLQQQLNHTEKMAAMGRLISGVAHELNNPLTAVFGNAQLLMLGATDDVTRQRAEVLISETERAAKIVRNLLTFARPYKPERRPILLDQLIEETLSQRAYDLNVHNITVVRGQAPEAPPVLADPHQIQQVLLNLLINAEQAVSNRAGGEIHVISSVDPAQEWIKVAIADNGPGIAAEILGRIFEPFFTTRQAGKGTGLGLAICYAILREHGGRIRGANRPEGGARFEFELPVHTGAASVPAASPTPPPTVPPAPGTLAPGKRILVVDDEEAIVRIVAGALAMVGHQVEVAQDGRVAVQKLTAGDFDLVLMDMKLPEFDGERIYEDVIRRKPVPPQVVIMTGDTVNQQTRRFLERTGLRCVEKPFKLEDIWDCVREAEHGAPRPSDPSASAPPAS